MDERAKKQEKLKNAVIVVLFLTTILLLNVTWRSEGQGSFRLSSVLDFISPDVWVPDADEFVTADSAVYGFGDATFSLDRENAKQQLQAVLDKRRAETETIAVPSDTEGLTCTLEIRCDAVLDHLDELDPEKANAIPESGIVLPATRVSFTSGDSAYDILRRTCLSNGIEISYDYAVNLSGYYIENLAGLAERECGPQSGWMYKVNGWFPNYGSSRYQVCDGDVIVWSYSCVGLGEDIGVEPWQSAEKSEITTEIK